MDGQSRLTNCSNTINKTNIKHFLRTFNTERGQSTLSIALCRNKVRFNKLYLLSSSRSTLYYAYGVYELNDGSFKIPLQNYNFVHRREKTCRATSRPEISMFVTWGKWSSWFPFTFGFGVCDQMWGGSMMSVMTCSDNLIMICHYLGPHMICFHHLNKITITWSRLLTPTFTCQLTDSARGWFIWRLQSSC